MQHMSKNCSVALYKQLIDRPFHTRCTPKQSRNEERELMNLICARFRRKHTMHNNSMNSPILHVYARPHGRSISHAASDSQSTHTFTDADTDKFMERLAEASLKNQPYGYYEILGGIPRTSKMSDIKAAYFKMAKRYHPDAYSEQGLFLNSFFQLIWVLKYVFIIHYCIFIFAIYTFLYR